jgi:hypothetical protein
MLWNQDRWKSRGVGKPRFPIFPLPLSRVPVEYFLSHLEGTLFSTTKGAKITKGSHPEASF